jgi:hypothetical protein
MKKEYMKPDMQVVELRRRNNLLAGSNTEIEIKRGNYVEEDMDDL